MPRLAPLDTSGPGWRVQQGQAVWKPRREGPELAGDLVLATHPSGASVAQFAKTPFPLVVAQTRTNAWQIEFVPQKLVFSGAKEPPRRFLWLHFSRALGNEPLPADLRFEKRAENTWRLENVRTGESLEGYLVP